jgi:hypothetical protein
MIKALEPLARKDLMLGIYAELTYKTRTLLAPQPFQMIYLLLLARIDSAGMRELQML